METEYISREFALHNIECGQWDTEKDKNRAIHYVRELTPAANVVDKAEWDKLLALVEEANKILESARWISVSERLPERPEGYPNCEIRKIFFLVALESGAVISLGFDFEAMRWHNSVVPVAYWRPLPEPPKEAKDG